MEENGEFAPSTATGKDAMTDPGELGLLRHLLILLARMTEMNQQIALSSLRGQEMVELLATHSPDTMFF